MTDAAPLTFSKEERICGEKSVSHLLAKGHYGAGGSFRFCCTGNDKGFSRIMISVPKKMFKRAVRRNLMKRRIREAYRHQKDLVKDTPVDILLIYNSKELIPYSDVFTQVGNILRRVSAKYTSKNKNKE